MFLYNVWYSPSCQVLAKFLPSQIFYACRILSESEPVKFGSNESAKKLKGEAIGLVFRKKFSCSVREENYRNKI